eukprot:m51a1_g2673 hypothetical protein (516) ;mRNA; r:719673-721370
MRSECNDATFAEVKTQDPNGGVPVTKTCRVLRAGHCRSEATKAGSRRSSRAVRVFELVQGDQLAWVHEDLVSFHPSPSSSAALSSSSSSAQSAASSTTASPENESIKSSPFFRAPSPARDGPSWVPPAQQSSPIMTAPCFPLPSQSQLPAAAPLSAIPPAMPNMSWQPIQPIQPIQAIQQMQPIQMGQPQWFPAAGYAAMGAYPSASPAFAGAWPVMMGMGAMGMGMGMALPPLAESLALGPITPVDPMPLQLNYGVSQVQQTQVQPQEPQQTQPEEPKGAEPEEAESSDAGGIAVPVACYPGRQQMYLRPSHAGKRNGSTASKAAKVLQPAIKRLRTSEPSPPIPAEAASAPVHQTPQEAAVRLGAALGIAKETGGQLPRLRLVLLLHVMLPGIRTADISKSVASMSTADDVQAFVEARSRGTEVGAQLVECVGVGLLHRDLVRTWKATNAERREACRPRVATLVQDLAGAVWRAKDGLPAAYVQGVDELVRSWEVHYSALSLSLVNAIDAALQ